MLQSEDVRSYVRTLAYNAITELFYAGLIW
jgi:hypothetical protein